MLCCPYRQRQSQHPQIKGEVGHRSDLPLSPVPLKPSGRVKLRVCSRMSQKQLVENGNFSITPVEILQNKGLRWGRLLWHTGSGERPTVAKPNVTIWQSLLFARTSKGGSYTKRL